MLFKNIRKRWCSTACQNAALDAQAEGRLCKRLECGRVFHSRNAVQEYCSRACNARDKFAARRASAEERKCKECSAPFIPGMTHQLFCSKPCTDRWWTRATRQLRRAGGIGDLINMQQLRARDAGHCGLCGKPISARWQFPDPRSASIDHILPISRGGLTVWHNVQLAHLGCNCGKGNSVNNEQTLLAGVA